jgi:hypothetical protein
LVILGSASVLQGQQWRDNGREPVAEGYRESVQGWLPPHGPPSGMERENSRSIVAASSSGRSSSTGSGGDRPRCGESERRERLRVVERGNLGDYPADAAARQVRRPVIELAGRVPQPRLQDHAPCKPAPRDRR